MKPSIGQAKISERPRRLAGPEIWLVLAATLAAGAAAGATPEDEVRRIVEEERERGGTPAMCVVAVRDGLVVVELASGFADREAGRAATLGTRFPAASVSKTLTAALVMRQVEEGRLDLDEPVNTYLEPALQVRGGAGEGAPATLRQLLSHSSGLPVAWSGIIDRANPVPTMEEHLARGLRTIHTPGERIVYSNDGFALAGFLAAQAAGQPFPEYAHRALFEPLGMSRSTFESPWRLEGSLAAAYGDVFKGGSERTHHADTTAIAPAGALITAAPDLARFALMLLGEGELDGVRVLRGESVAEMMRLQARAHPELDEGFGLGFAVRERPGRRMVWWDGSLHGAAARLSLLPDEDAGVVVLSNLADNGPTSVTGRRVLDLIVPPPAAAGYQPSAAELDRVAGQYRLRDFVDPEFWYLPYLMSLGFERRGDTLVQSSRLTGESALRPTGPNRFRIQGSMFDDSTVLFDGDWLYVGMMRARRISAWESPTALLVYAVLLALALASLLGWGAWRGIRRLRRPRGA
ncbi:MAG: beta-lactamase family protein [bacterium]|nr:beta-lactamase family protein [bacterium]